MLHVFREYDMELRWSVVSANRDPEIVKQLLFHPLTLPGFNDSGAHLTNMAFYDANLRGLQLAQEQGINFVAKHVRRLTREPAEFIGIEAGAIEVNHQADIIIVDPKALAAYDSEANTCFEYREEFEHEQMVNRSNGIVTHTLVAGELVWDGKQHTSILVSKKLGRALRHKSHKNVNALKPEEEQRVA
jgi:N-acyl-D-aspartate/D-glutamate deacylase